MEGMEWNGSDGMETWNGHLNGKRWHFRNFWSAAKHPLSKSTVTRPNAYARCALSLCEDYFSISELLRFGS